MNILWIEDFDKTTPAAINTVIKQIFGEFIKNIVIDPEEINLLKHPEKLTKILDDIPNNIHRIWLRRNFNGFEEFYNLQDTQQQIDVVLLDINLAVDPANKEKELNNRGYQREKGGLFIYNFLVHNGYPKQKICILTGEKNTLVDFNEECKKILISEPPLSFEKSLQYPELRQWLSNKAQNPYITLRRGIISACQSIRTLIEQHGADKIQFKEFLKDKPEDSELVTNMRDYLETLEKFLPIVEPIDKARYYKLFVRTLAHEWEDNASPSNLELDEKAIINKATKAFGWIMKSVRNWMAHNALTEEFNETFVAFLFIVAMRSMFKLEDNQLSYEKILFSLFENAVEERKMKEIIKNREIPLAETYIEVSNKFDMLPDKNENKKDFNSIVNALQMKGVEHDYIKSLYQIYWFTLPQLEINRDKPQKEQAKDKWIYTTTFSIKTGISYGKNQFEENPEFFLFHFSRHIYNYSF